MKANKCGLSVALVIGGILSIFASSKPDGLEKVAEDEKFMESAISFWQGLMPDYVMPGVSITLLAAALAGIAGTLIVFGFLKLIELIINKSKHESK